LLNSQGSRKIDHDIKVICNHLLQERLWKRNPTSIELYSIKKHINKIPNMSSKNIGNMSKRDFDIIKSSEWGKVVKEQKPDYHLQADKKEAESRMTV